MKRGDRTVIHAFSALAAGVGAGLAQLPCSDAAVLVPLQATMIGTLAAERGVTLDRTAAAQLVLSFGATMAGRSASQVLLGWVPGWGNVLNASTAAGLTEAVGWAAVAWFDRCDRARELP
ncbi:MAG: hypothetical protein ABIO70_10095 [Pseudomonadota bacterium]